MVQIISPQQYLPDNGPSPGSAISGALFRIYQMVEQERQRKLQESRTALEGRRVAVQEARDNRSEHRLDEQLAQSSMDRQRAALEDSIKSMAGESNAPILDAMTTPVTPPPMPVAPDMAGGPSAIPQVPQLPGQKDISAQLGGQFGDVGGLIAAALKAGGVSGPKPDGSPMISSVFLPPKTDAKTGANVPGKRVPLKFREDVLGEEQRAGKVKAAQVGQEEKARTLAKGKQVERTVDLGDKVEYIYTDGTTQRKPKGASPKAPTTTGLSPERQDRLVKILPEAGDWEGITTSTPTSNDETMRGGARSALKEWAASTGLLLPDATDKKAAFAAKETLADVSEAKQLLNDPEVQGNIGRYRGTVTDFVQGGWIPGKEAPPKVRQFRTVLNRMGAQERHKLYGSALTKIESKYSEGFIPTIKQPLGQIGAALDEFDGDVRRAMGARFGKAKGGGKSQSLALDGPPVITEIP